MGDAHRIPGRVPGFVVLGQSLCAGATLTRLPR